jgi:hypothetical protein
VSESTTLDEMPIGTAAPAAPAADSPATDAQAESSWAGPESVPSSPPTAVADAAPPMPPAEPPAPVPAAPAAKPPRRSVHVPMWLLGILAMGILVAGAFFVGRETAPDASPSGPTTLAEAVEDTAAGEMPVGDFNLGDLVTALQQNGNLNLDLGDILDALGGLGGGNR